MLSFTDPQFTGHSTWNDHRLRQSPLGAYLKLSQGLTTLILLLSGIQGRMYS